MSNLTVARAASRARQGAGAFFVVQIKRGEQAIVRPAKDERIQIGDEVLVLVRDAGTTARAAEELFHGQGRDPGRPAERY